MSKSIFSSLLLISAIQVQAVPLNFSFSGTGTSNTGATVSMAGSLTVDSQIPMSFDGIWWNGSGCVKQYNATINGASINPFGLIDSSQCIFYDWNSDNVKNLQIYIPQIQYASTLSFVIQGASDAANFENAVSQNNLINSFGPGGPFSFVEWHYFNANEDYRGPLTSFQQIQSVDEPGTLGLLALSSALLVMRRKSN